MTGPADLQTPPRAAERAQTEGAPFPPALARKVWRCLEAAPEQLIERGLVTSAEQLARLIPPLTAQAVAAQAPPALGRLHQALYLAHRRRRSLLLLDLAHQVRFAELPWVQALRPHIPQAQACRTLLGRVASYQLRGFPETLTPNPLVRELSELSRQAQDDRVWVEELAADIFMGRFAPKFTAATRHAGDLLRGSLYERYYGLDYPALAPDKLAPHLRLTQPEAGNWRTRLHHRLKAAWSAIREPSAAEPPELELNAVCEALAPPASTPGWSVSRNGQVLEQAQLLTTQNLQLLVELWAADPQAPAPRPGQLRPPQNQQLVALVARCWGFIRSQLRPAFWRQLPQTGGGLHRVKRVAYAWRQLILLLSWLPPETQQAQLQSMAQDLRAQGGVFAQRFAPALTGLMVVQAGDRFDPDGRHPASGGRRLLGWDPLHWLLQAPASPNEKEPQPERRGGP